MTNNHMDTPDIPTPADIYRVYNFGAGPSALPLEVLMQVKEDLPSWHGRGYSVLEMGHRSKDFQKIADETSALLKELYGISDDYDVLFMQGGGHLQFAMIPLNLRSFGQGNYCVNGVWSSKAFSEAVRIGQAAEAVRVENRAPRQDEIRLTEDAGFLYYCSNETVNGIRYWYVPETKVALVSDMSSDFLSQKVDVSKFSIIFAGAQKNFGTAGLTVGIVKKDIIGQCPPTVPSMLDYATYAKSGSMYNTPPTFAIYVANLVCRWLMKQGGIEEMERRSIIKSGMIYDLIDSSKGFYKNHVEKKSRSRMNVVFNLEDETLNQKFLDEAKEKKIENIKGHRIVGGMRASLYNAVTIEAAEKLAEFMAQFQEQNR